MFRMDPSIPKSLKNGSLGKSAPSTASSPRYFRNIIGDSLVLEFGGLGLSGVVAEWDLRGGLLTVLL